ncbi:hypothetical protein [Mycobacterium intracellulare]|uniref:hypothetical protein n=1 Tax=Mycobacterium intracellulare TaxID=1767 RepID=UPI00137AF94A|nr:hypothetical protein [Mycobacterium intracellulare]MDM3909615.1 hypothetical protein [Mycobacterium intracellulare subsp. chimaera]
MIEAVVWQELVGSDRIPAPVIDWLVNGYRSAPAPACDVSYPRAGYAGLLEF